MMVMPGTFVPFLKLNNALGKLVGFMDDRLEGETVER